MSKHKLSLSYVVAVSVGAMLFGLFILPGMAYAIAGPGLIAAYVIASFFALIAVFSKAEITSAMPTSASAYFYVARSFGSGVGMTYGLLTWLSLALKSAVGLLAVATFSSLFFQADPRVIAIVLTIILTTVNIVGIRHVGKFQMALVLLVGSILAYLVWQGTEYINIINYKGFLASGSSGIFAAAGFIFVSYGGLLKVASVAEEIENPGKNVPKGMLISLAIITIIYISVIFVTIGVVSPEALSGSLRPISLMAEQIGGSPWTTVMAICAILAIIGATNAGIMAASRYPAAIANDDMLPKSLGKLHSRFQTPVSSLLLTSLVVIAALFFDIKVVIKAASAVLILTYMFSAIALIILRESKLGNYRPQFTSPLYPWLQIIGIIGFSFMLYGIGGESLLIMLMLSVLGFGIYWIFGRKKTQKEFALLHLIERITNRELTSNTLEQELLDIVHHRDGVSKDRFDYLVEQSPVLDIETAIDMSTFFKMIAEKLSESLGIPEKELNQKFCDRENDTSTVLLPFLSVPHILVDGKNVFHLLIVRCKDGISFPGQDEKVVSAFVMVGSRDERTFHLQALAAVAQISQSPEFEERWIIAKSEQDIRNILLLGRWRH